MKQIDTFWCAMDLNLDCNRDCSFCCKRGENPGLYTTEELKKVVKLLGPTILKYNAKRVCIPILGGEPLLHPELPIETLEAFKALPVAVDMWMYTNGDFLTDRIMEKYKEKRIWITLSAAESSLKELLNKINFLKRHYRIPRLSITLSKANLNRLDDIVTKSLENKFTIRFRHQYSATPELAKLYEEIVPVQLARYLRGEHITLNNMMFTYEDAIPGWNELKSPYVCGRSFFHFSSDGTVRNCSGTVDNNAILTINDKSNDLIVDIKNHIANDKGGRWSAQNIAQCQGCPVYGACQGGCPLTRKLAYGVYNKPTPYCLGIKKAMKVFLDAAKLHR